MDATPRIFAHIIDEAATQTLAAAEIIQSRVHVRVSYGYLNSQRKHAWKFRISPNESESAPVRTWSAPTHTNEGISEAWKHIARKSSLKSPDYRWPMTGDHPLVKPWVEDVWIQFYDRNRSSIGSGSKNSSPTAFW